MRRRLPWYWLAFGVLLASGAAAITLASPRFGPGVEVRGMPILALVAGLGGLGLLYVACAPALMRLSARCGEAHVQPSLAIVVLTGLLARLVLMAGEPILEDDYYRYLWDGAVAAHGSNPYAIAPHDAARGAVPPGIADLARQAGPVLERVNHADLRTIYPPVAQASFALAHLIGPWSLAAWRAVLLGSDIAALALMLQLLAAAGRSPLWAALYWLNPVILKEAYNSAHVDVVTGPFVLGALLLSTRGRPALAACSLALAAGVKVWPLLLLPLVVRQATGARRLLALLACAGISALLALPMIAAGMDETSGIYAYAVAWQTNSALFPVLAAIAAAAHDLIGLSPEQSGLSARAVVAAALAALALTASAARIANPDDLMGRASFIVGALLILAPAQLPWYYLWFAVFLPFRPWFGFLLLAATLPLYYTAFHFISRGEGAVFRTGVVWLIWAPVWAALLAEWAWRRQARLGNPGALRDA